VCSFLYLSTTSGFIVTGMVVFIIYLSIQERIYTKNEHYMPNIWFYINCILSFVLIITPVVLGLILNNFLAYIGFSISVWTLAFFMMIYSVSSIYSDIMNRDANPLFYSPWIFPVYAFNPKKNDIISRNRPNVILILSLMIMICWSATCTVWVKPYSLGIALGIAF
jgi:hypothetical protein